MEFSKAIPHIFSVKTLIYSAILFMIVDILSSPSITKAPIPVSISSSHPITFLKSANNSTNIMNKKVDPSSLIRNLKNTSFGKRPVCDIFQGRWVVDGGRSRPSYEPGECPFIQFSFNCFNNGRLDLNYTMLRWRPSACSLPRLTGSKMLKFLRGKRMAFVGDSLSKNMWQSLLCMLRHSATGNKNVLKKSSGTYHFTDYNFTVDYFQSPFLVQEYHWNTPDRNRNRNGALKETLRLDVMDKVSENYKNADIIVFNSGHWWKHRITNHGNNFYQEDEYVHSHLSPETAFRKALRTWSGWVDANINSTRTQVFFRSYSPEHYSGGQWNSGGSCRGVRFPIRKTNKVEKPVYQDAVESALRRMSTPVRYLNITMMSNYRKDAHPSIFRGETVNETIQDCGHWCLPGVPDAWNELLFAMLMTNKNRFQIKEHALN